jgi:hypothetical protein
MSEAITINLASYKPGVTIVTKVDIGVNPKPFCTAPLKGTGEPGFTTPPILL